MTIKRYPTKASVVFLDTWYSVPYRQYPPGNIPSTQPIQHNSLTFSLPPHQQPVNPTPPS